MNIKYLLLLSVILISGCVTSRDYIGIIPVEPVPGKHFGHHMLEDMAMVKSTQPTLKWTAIEAAGFSYDLAIWKRPETQEIKYVSLKYNEPEYYVEGIEQAQHKVETALEADTIYMWTVRSRKGDKVGAWSAYKETLIAGGSRQISNVPFSFRTPEK